MRINTKKLLIGLIFNLFFFFNWSITAIDLKKYNAKDNPDIFLWCHKQCKKEEKQLIQDILEKAGLKNSKWKALKKDIKKSYQEAISGKKHDSKCKKTFSKKSIAAIKAVLNNKKIAQLLEIKNITYLAGKIVVERKKHPSFTIISVHEHFDCDAATDECNLFINETSINESHATQAEIEATLAHEMIHIVYKDAFTVFCLETVIDDMPKNCQNKIKKPFCRLMHLQEQRADILSALTNKKYIRASRNFFKRQIQEEPQQHVSDTHPTNKQRVYDMQLLEKVINEPPKKTNTRFYVLLLLLCFKLLFLCFSQIKDFSK